VVKHALAESDVREKFGAKVGTKLISNQLRLFPINVLASGQRLL
jgi:hypothetical protein